MRSLRAILGKLRGRDGLLALTLDQCHSDRPLFCTPKHWRRYQCCSTFKSLLAGRVGDSWLHAVLGDERAFAEEAARHDTLSPVPSAAWYQMIFDSCGSFISCGHHVLSERAGYAPSEPRRVTSSAQQCCPWWFQGTMRSLRPQDPISQECLISLVGIKPLLRALVPATCSRWSDWGAAVVAWSSCWSHRNVKASQDLRADKDDPHLAPLSMIAGHVHHRHEM